MQRIFVDFGRGTDDAIDLLMTARPNVGITLQEGERVILYDSSLEVEGAAHQGTAMQGQTYWYALPDWATSKDLDVTPSLTQSAG
jgi:hypothetical protein